MKKTLLCLFTIFSFSVFGQDQAFYYFQDGLKEYQNKFFPLTVLGEKGTFVDEIVPKFGQNARKVYTLPANSGLNFDNTKAKNFINGSFALELYFKYDDGDLLIYNHLIGGELKNKQGKYVHLVTTRDANSKKVVVYVDGKKQIDWVDKEKALDIDAKSHIMFFYAPGKSTSSGAVAMIKLYNYFVDQDKAQNLFKAFDSENSQVSDLKKGFLNNLYFAKSEANFLPESMPELENLNEYLKKNANIKVMLSGFTDNVGDYDLNLILSQKRAAAVKTYLTDKGIAADRIQTQGFGSLKPIAENNSEGNRAKNRRVEMKVL